MCKSFKPKKRNLMCKHLFREIAARMKEGRALYLGRSVFVFVQVFLLVQRAVRGDLAQVHRGNRNT